MRYFIGYLGPEEVEKYYQTLTTELHVKFGVGNLSLRIPSHLTMKYPFETDDTSIVEIAGERIERFLKNKTPVSFIIEGFDTFDDNNQTIFLSPKPDEKLRTFAENCIIELNGLGDGKMYDPKKFRIHMSVARYLTPDTFEPVWAYLKALPEPRFELSFDNLTLFVLENDVWGVKRKFLLGYIYYMKLFLDHPHFTHFPGDRIEVMECLPMPKV